MTPILSADSGSSVRNSLDVLRRLDRLKDEVQQLRDRIEQVRPERTILHPERHRAEPPYAPDTGGAQSLPLDRLHLRGLDV